MISSGKKFGSDGQGIYQEVWDTKTKTSHHRYLANFSAVILHEIVDEQAQSSRTFIVEVALKSKKKRVLVTAEEFLSSNWILKKLGAEFIVVAGYGISDTLREAIQALSQNVTALKRISRIGYVFCNNKLYYVHSHGLIGPKADPNPVVLCAHKAFEVRYLRCDSPISPVSTKIASVLPLFIDLPEALSQFDMRAPQFDPQWLIDNAKKVFGLLDAAFPRELWLPLFAACIRAVLGPADFSIMVVGPTNIGKSFLTGVFQSFFGSRFHGRNLPVSGDSTANYIAEITSITNDALLVIDDVKQDSPIADSVKADRQIDRIARSLGNHSARGRMKGSGGVAAGHKARCMAVQTAETLPTGASLLSRVYTVSCEHRKEGATKDVLEQILEASKQGLFAELMSSVIATICTEIGLFKHFGTTYRQEWREQFGSEVSPKTLPRQSEMAEELYAAFRLFLFIVDREVPEESLLDEDYCNDFWATYSTINSDLAYILIKNLRHETHSDPLHRHVGLRFLDYVMGALASRQAHIANRDGQAPDNFQHALGWEGNEISEEFIGEDGEPDRRTKTVWNPNGMRIGWYNNENLYLSIQSSLAVARRVAASKGDTSFDLTEKSVGASLEEIKALSGHEKGRYTVKFCAGGVSQRALAIPLSKLPVIGQTEADCFLLNDPSYEALPEPSVEDLLDC